MRGILAAATLCTLAIPAHAQDSDQAETCQRSTFYALPSYRSVEPLADGRVTFRICAPQADEVHLVSVDMDFAIPMDGCIAMVRQASGLWEATTSVPVPADNYRFNFEVDGLRVPDPSATRFSRERIGINSTTDIPGEEGAFQAWNADVPHGMLTQIEYWSEPLGVRRPANVYTPPGYMKDARDYPVLYLVHGAGDSSDSWTQVGHAHYILDNLIASGTAQDMIIVMPEGHTPDGSLDLLQNGNFGDDLHDALIPFIDANFRTIADADHRAMAGLSMGGSHTIQFGLPRTDRFSELGIFSMGLGTQADDVANYTGENGDALRRAAEELDLVYYAMGETDFLYNTVAPTRAMLEEYGIDHVYHESDGGHTWINWRRYLRDFLPRLFRED